MHFRNGLETAKQHMLTVSNVLEAHFCTQLNLARG